MGTFGKLAALTASVAVLTACPGDPITPGPTFEWFGILEGEEGWEHLSGEVGMLWAEGGTVIAARAFITGDAPGQIRPWHVHHNTCAEGGGIVGPEGAYPPLTIGANGEAEVITNVPVVIDADASFHVNVHLSFDEPETIIACGDLTVIGPV